MAIPCPPTLPYAAEKKKMSDEILERVTRVEEKLNALHEDIGEIKEYLKNFNEFKHRLIRLEVIVFIIASGGITGITKGIGWW